MDLLSFIIFFMPNVNQWKKTPHTPGIYIFKKATKPLYIGKAADLRKRLASYFREKVSEKIRQMLAEATKLEWIETSSEVEAFLKEAELIKKYRPKYNYLLRDDKNYFYVGITDEAFPKIFLTHQPVFMRSGPARDSCSRTARYVGPFTSGAALKSVLRLLRHIFPYCTCRTPHKRFCLNAQIGRCPGYCCISRSRRHTDKLGNAGMIFTERKEYDENIKNVISVLYGKRKRILADLRNQMQNAAQKEEFEKAAKIRDQIKGLENIFSHRQFLENRPQPFTKREKGWVDTSDWPKTEKYIRQLLGIKNKISRVEGYDISNISGTEATGSMVVFIDGLPAKSKYRKFKIKTVHGANDVGMLKEVIKRRLAHHEWPYPELMLIDGGRPQLNAVLAVLRGFIHKSIRMKRDAGKLVEFVSTSVDVCDIKVASLAKKEEELYLENRKAPIRLFTLPQSSALFFQHVRDESHRFAKKYHLKLREISYRKYTKI